ncbi:BTB/POZ domain-containing protein At5g66560-like isoform X2 [Phragmites australis]|uniref:BTB/POZ domain-containing protein At5g66560-like isoform X2 n=1 Tax=Phragmites australis TaxID=29695 RepID=UPI002D79C839|nr:BTB/POZ domain-containing protein At5g66560-like isoform X2 [Phragmites australis]
MPSSVRHGSSRGQAWFCTTGLPSDVVFEVHDMAFHLHKFPLMSKSRKIHRMLTEQEEERPARGRRRRRRSDGGDAGDDGAAETEIEEAEEEEEEVRRTEGDGQPYSIVFPDFPGGSGTFEAAAKFCYGVRVDLTAWNVAPLRCAAEYLEMTEEHAEDNLVARAEAYLEQTVLRHPGDATKALKSCEELLPLAEELGIVARCVEAIAARSSAASRSWFDDLAVLGLHMYKRVMAAMAARDDVRTEARESCLVSYARGTIPGLSRSMRRRLASAPVSSEVEQKELLEAVVASLPANKCSGRVVTAKFLFALLRTAHILRASDAARAALERKVATQLEQATLEDVLIPSYSGAAETLYDVDCVERVVRYFLAEEEVGEASSSAAIEEAAAEVSRPSAVAMVQVGKLVDSYLAEVASDANLKPAKFCELALALPDHARIYDDGVYRAVDIYLKAHPRLTAEERDRVVSVVDCRKLTVEACTHAAQNERLPLRAVLQVLFFEQLQLRRAITGTRLAPPAGPQARRQQPAGSGEAWRGVTALAQENQVLRLDMDSVASRVQELERECSSMRRAIKKIDGRSGSRSPGSADGSRPAASSWRARYGCKFSTQVCDSQARNVVASRASRMGMSP